MFRHWFLDHPGQVGESYSEHQRTALAFSAKLLMASMACFIHAVVPHLFQRTASGVVVRLYGEMNGRRKSLEGTGLPQASTD